MTAHVAFLLLGLGAGAVYGLLGLGLVVEYRSSGVVNFGHAAMAMLVAYEFVELRSDGVLVVPLVGLPDRWHVAHHGLSLAPAIAISLTYALVLGMVVYLVVFRPLRHRPVLARAVASVGVALIAEGLAVLHFGSVSRTTGTVLPSQRLHVGGSIVPTDRLYLCGVAVVLAFLLWAVYRFTLFGLATRAAAESEKGAVLSGYSPNSLALVNWMVATLLAGVAGILAAPVTPLDPASYTLFVIPALACALAGRFRSFPTVLGTALLVGSVQAEIANVQVTHRLFSEVSLGQVVPFVVIVVLMAWRGGALPRRGEITETRFPRSGAPQAIGRSALIAATVGVAALLVLHGGYRAALIHSLVATIICLSFVVLTGYCGQVSLAQLSVAGFSGFALSQLTLHGGLPIPFAAAVAVVLAVPFGLAFGLPALRLRGVELGIVTMAGALTAEGVLFKSSALVGTLGSAEIREASIFGHHVGRASFGFGVLVLATTVALGAAVSRLRTHALGRRMLAVRSTERAAAAAGVNVARTKVAAFSVSAGIAAIGGAALGYEIGQLSADSFRVLGSLMFLALAYTGGVTLVSGAVVAGVLLAPGGLMPTVVERHLSVAPYQLLIVGIGVIAATVAHDAGIASAMARTVSRLRFLRAAPRPPPAPLAGPSLDGLLPAPGSGLAVSGVSVHFGGVAAVDDVTIAVGHGSIVGVIGPNGAGKTTLIDAISGFVATDSGRVSLDGHDISALRPDQRVRLGLSRTFQFDELFEELSAWENLLVAANTPADAWLGVDVAALHGERDRIAADLSPASRKAVSLGRAISGRPSLLVLDEPSSGLDGASVERLAVLLRDLATVAGLGIVLVDHDLPLVLRCCDDVYVLDRGRVIAHGPPDRVRRDTAVAAVYLGTA